MSETERLTATQLANRIYDLVATSNDYESSADAMWKAALEAFNYVAREVGATGFQASWAALRFYGEAEGIKCPYMVIRAEDALYPQYDLNARVPDFLAKNVDWLREQAAEKLAAYEAEPTHTYTDDDGNEQTHDSAHPNVVAHWRSLVGEAATR